MRRLIGMCAIVWMAPARIDTEIGTKTIVKICDGTRHSDNSAAMHWLVLFAYLAQL